jgi:hypothetical protein
MFPVHRISIRAMAWHCWRVRADRTHLIFSRIGAGARDHIELWDGLWDFLRLVSWLED